MGHTPIERTLVDNIIKEFNIKDFSKTTIREVKAIAEKLFPHRMTAETTA